MKNQKLKNLVLSAMFLAIGIVLPFITGQIQQIGNMLLPMHIPVFLAGLICGWQYGLGVGLIVPVLRSILFTMPPLYPAAVAMTFELGAYGLVSGFLYSRSKEKNIWSLYGAMLSAMVSGRIVWGIMQVILLGISGSVFTFKAFIAGALLNAVPGIIIQLILIPAVMIALKRARFISLK